jgi:non-ribosomal peptide synthetase component F
MAVLSKTEISALSTQERLALIDELWESLEVNQTANQAAAAISSAQLPDWQRRILDERLHDLEICPGDDVSLAEARSQSLL